MLIVEAFKIIGSVITIALAPVISNEHPLASVISTVYVPADNPVTAAVVAPLAFALHKYV